MKKLFTIISIMALSYGVSAQTNVATGNQVQAAKEIKPDEHAGHNHGTTQTHTNIEKAETLAFAKSEHDFGKIPQGKPVSYVFEFKNTGTSPLKLENVQASCGCTTPEWSKDDVAPGATAKITVGYNAAAEGTFVKPITITYNGGLTKVLNIKGEVWKTPATSAPENSTLNTIKN